MKGWGGGDANLLPLIDKHYITYLMYSVASMGMALILSCSVC